GNIKLPKLFFRLSSILPATYHPPSTSSTLQLSPNLHNSGLRSPVSKLSIAHAHERRGATASFCGCTVPSPPTPPPSEEGQSTSCRISHRFNNTEHRSHKFIKQSSAIPRRPP